MRHEQLIYRKKLFRLDGVLLLCMILGLAAAVMPLRALAGVLPDQVGPLFQYAALFALLVACYFLLMRQLSAYRYVLTEESFTVYRILGRSERLAARVDIAGILFITPYLSPVGERGRESVFCAARKQAGVILAYDADGRRQWLVISPNADMLGALNQALSGGTKIYG